MIVSVFCLVGSGIVLDWLVLLCWFCFVTAFDLMDIGFDTFSWNLVLRLFA